MSFKYFLAALLIPFFGHFIGVLTDHPWCEIFFHPLVMLFTVPAVTFSFWVVCFSFRKDECHYPLIVFVVLNSAGLIFFPPDSLMVVGWFFIPFYSAAATLIIFLPYLIANFIRKNKQEE